MSYTESEVVEVALLFFQSINVKRIAALFDQYFFSLGVDAKSKCKSLSLDLVATDYFYDADDTEISKKLSLLDDVTVTAIIVIANTGVYTTHILTVTHT